MHVDQTPRPGSIVVGAAIIGGVLAAGILAAVFPMEYERPRAPMVSDIAPNTPAILKSTDDEGRRFQFAGDERAREFLVRLPAEAFLVSLRAESGPLRLTVYDANGTDWIELFRADGAYSGSIVYAPERPSLFVFRFAGPGRWKLDVEHASTVAFPIIGK